jgi:hypothetical protein
MEQLTALLSRGWGRRIRIKRFSGIVLQKPTPTIHERYQFGHSE